MRGRLISFEGGEGAGKSTVIGAVEAWLAARGVAFLRVREPGGTAVGEAVRAVLLDRALAPMAARAELLLMFASRAQLVETVVAPALAAGTWVIADRFTDASFAYQGGGRGLDAGLIAELERWAVGIAPDLTFLLDVDVRTGLERALRRSGGADRIESESLAFFERVRAAYLQRARAQPQRWRILDAAAPADAVAAAAVQALECWAAGRTDGP